MIAYHGQGFLDPCPSLSPHLQYFILNVLDVYMRCVHLQSSLSPRQESCSTSQSHSASCGWRPDAPPHSSNLGKTDFMADRRIHKQRNFSIFCTTSREQGPTGSRYPTRSELFFKYPTRPDPKIQNDWVPGNKISAIKHRLG